MQELSNKRQQLLVDLQADAFKYFVNEVNTENGLVADSTKEGWPSSIAAVDMALAAYPVGVERGLISREEAIVRTLRKLRFFANSPQGKARDATGYKGFYYHFLDMQTGRRAWQCEVSTVDSGFLFAGMLTAAAYFKGDSEDEAEIRTLADMLYRRADWQWATNGKATLTHDWKPETGFLPYRWDCYDESLLMYILSMGSPTFPLPFESYQAQSSGDLWRKVYDYELLSAGPLFVHQLSQVWLDLRGLQDALMRERGLDYFENSRRATYVQQEYARRNPQGFAGYSEVCWGLTASEGPGPATKQIDGVERVFFDYIARGVPDGPDDGTVAPWAVVASLPFAPEIVLPTLEHFEQMEIGTEQAYGLEATFNPTFPDEQCRKCGWLSPWHYGINEGPIVLMIENYRTEWLWRLMRTCPYIVNGLRRAGFRGGWL
ncbi:MAG: glucoamylase family protein [Pyrinomonadaceae bacterium]